MRLLFLVLWGLALTGLCVEVSAVPDLLEEIALYMPERRELPVMERCIELSEEALSLSPGDPGVLVLLAQLWHEHAVLVTGDESVRLSSLKTAADYACEAMGMESYVALERMSVDELKAYLDGVDAPGALLWAGDSWGKILGTNQLHAFMVSSVPKLRALYGRLVEVDETYFGAAGHRSLGALEANVWVNWIARGLFGGSIDRAREHFERALALAPEYLLNHVEYANHLARPERQWELFDELLHHVFRAPLEPEPFWNSFAKADALELLQREGRTLPEG